MKWLGDEEHIWVLGVGRRLRERLDRIEFERLRAVIEGETLVVTTASREQAEQVYEDARRNLTDELG